MLAPPIPENEAQRLSSLHALQILDTPPEERFDRITRLAKLVFGVPISLISLVADERQWFKSVVGLPICETSRDVSFCAHAILSRELFIIPDTLVDVRFADNPLVTGEHHIRFYAGCPLYALDGSALGSFCILDCQPREFSASDRQILRDLGTWVENEINAIEISQTLVQRESEMRQRAFMESTNEVLMLIGNDQRVQRVNRCFFTFFDIPADEVTGTSCHELTRRLENLFVNPQEVHQLFIGVTDDSERELTVNLIQCKPQQRTIEISSTPIHNDTEYLGRLYIFRDITERAAMLETLQHQAKYDPLTDLPNRTFLEEQIETALLASQKNSAVLLLLDLDRFKEVNDTFGHQQGDLLLLQVSARLRDLISMLPASATIARLGGDEFALLLPLGEEENAHAVVQALRRTFEEPFTIADMLVQIDVSIGVVCSPTHGDDAQTLLRRADIAMYIAKRAHTGYAFYDASVDKSSPRRLAIIEALRQAITSDALQLYYQPKADVKTGNVRSIEALVRWLHPTYGSIPPDEFIPLAEQMGLIAPLTLWVIETALRQCQTWRRTGLELAVAVNLSMWNLRDLTLPDTIGSMLQRYGIPPSLLCVELTEGAIMTDIHRTVEVLKRLVALGIRVAIDDFGTGYSSLAYIKRLPIHELKIDRSFVQYMATNQVDTTIVRSTVALAHHLGLQVVAEGVEDAKTWELLAAMDCDTIQGYYLSRPLPATEFELWLKQRDPASSQDAVLSLS
ncbi:MAG TPA: EAL domain-containing protein [Ktedonobacteraceae bacterium]|nr:EAL domain-containing protein [Ktedonobacteraceae bacterium]